jgi:hypothetical protein
MGYVLSLSSNLSVGGELFIYVRSSADGGSVISIPITLGGYPVSYCGSYDSGEVIINPTIEISCVKSGNTIISCTTATLHIFFDGNIYYIDRL